MPLGFAPLGSTPIGASAHVEQAVAAPTITSVVVWPAVVTLADGQLQDFIADVMGEGAFDPAVTWTTEIGTIDADGKNLTLPSTLVERTVVVTATSVQDQEKVGTALVTQLPAVVDPPDEPPPIEPAERFARPVSDINKGAWQPSTGTDLFAMVDDMALDNSDYISAVGATTCELALAPVRDPGTRNNQAVRYQAHAPDGGSLTVTLKQGSTVIASWHHATLPTVETVHEQRLTPEQCDSITDYHDLRVELAAA